MKTPIIPQNFKCNLGLKSDSKLSALNKKLMLFLNHESDSDCSVIVLKLVLRVALIWRFCDQSLFKLQILKE